MKASDRISLQKILSQDKRNVNGDATSQEGKQEKYSMGETFDREYRGLWEKYGEQITAERGQRRTDAPLGSAITKKSEDYLKSKTTKAAKALAKAMNIPYSAEKGQIKTALAEAMTEISEKGGLSAESSDALFEKAYQAGVMVLDDYYNQYKDLRKEISQTRFAVTESDKEEFADWAEFRKKNFGKILTAKDGIPIDTKYMELNEEYPEMFPQTITHPGDQLRRIAEVRAGIEKTEIDLSQYKGEEAEEFKKFARHEFDRIMNDMIDEVNVAKRYEEDRAASKAAEKILGLLPEEVREAYERDKTLKKAESKAKRLNLLTKDDRNTVDRLLRGELTLDQLPQGSNKKGIKAVFEAEKARTENMKPVMQYRADLRESRTARAEEIIANADLWKDKANGLLYSRETAERNMRDITKNKADADRLIEAYFKPVHVNEAKSLRLQNDLRGKIRDLKIGADEAYDLTYQTPDKETVTGKASESALVQLLGEGVITEKQVEECGADAGKIKAAVETMREIYNDLFEQINASLISNGYPPADYRKDYFPHFDKYRPESVLSKIFHKMGMEINEDKLPTDIAGLTHTFRPGKKWFGNLLQRTGTATDYDALEGFDRYLNTAADVIFHTGDIQNLRALENAMRYKFSSGGTKEEIDRLKARKDLDELVKEQMIQDLYERDNTKFGNFATWLRNYTDNLAGKKAIGDRVFEQDLGRAVYDVSKKLEGRIAANMVAINPGSWLTNFIPLTQGGAQLKATSMLKAMQDTVKAYARDDGFSDASDFLTGRKGTQLLALSKADKFADFFSKPMTLIDDFTSNTLVRARYAENLKAGMTQDQALREADSWTAGVMADRSKGSMPTVFNQKNPVAKVVTMFQLEVNNQYSYLFKDIPREEKEKGILMLAWTMTKFFVGARIFNEIYRRLVGRNAAFEPFQILQDAVVNLNDPNMSNSKALGILGKDLLEETPFVGGLLGGGRLPISSALPNLGDLTKLTDDISLKKKGEIVKREIMEKPVAYLALPFGGGQMKKLSQSIDLMRQGGSFTYDNDGNKRLQFLADQDFTTALKTAIFGKYATKQAQEYVDSNFYTYTAKATAVITSAKDHGLEPQRVKKIVDDMRKMNISRNKEGSGTSAAELKMNYLFKQKDLNEEQRAWLGEELARNSAKTPYDYSTQAAMQISMIGGKAPEKAKKAEEEGIDNETYLAAYEAQKKSFGTGSGIPAAKMKKKAIDEATPDLTGTQRRLLYELFEVRKDAWGN